MSQFLPTWLIAAIAVPMVAGAPVEFRGVPSVKVSESGVERVVEKISVEKAAYVACVISEVDGKYFWASRDNAELVPVDGGAFTTYLASDGSGYVRILKPAMKETAAIIGKTEAAFDYVEHMLTGLTSVTYYGVSTERENP